jgi:hypothetical protein
MVSLPSAGAIQLIYTEPAEASTLVVTVAICAGI